MAASVEILSEGAFAERAAEIVARSLPARGNVVITGGGTAEKVYGPLAALGADWSGLTVFFSDERCVPPDNPASNYGMARRLLLEPGGIRKVHRMRGEADPTEAASEYHELVAAVAGRSERSRSDTPGSNSAEAPGVPPGADKGFDLAVLGLGDDSHVAGLFPGSPALGERERLCAAVRRPDGLGGLTLTPPALLAAKKVIFIVEGEAKADAVRRALRGSEPPEIAPVRLYADHTDVTFLTDPSAASHL